MPCDYTSFAIDNNNSLTIESSLLLKCSVEFYRSKMHAEGNSGNSDNIDSTPGNGYGGNFGFDRFIKSEKPEINLLGKYSYEYLPGVIPDESIISRGPITRRTHIRRYPCPYLTLWPPIVNLPGSTDNISSNDKSQAIISVRAKKYHNKPTGEIVSIVFAVEDEYGRPVNEITVNDAQNITIDLKIGGGDDDTRSFSIKCLRHFNRKIYINAYLIDCTTNRRAIVGRLVIPPNNEIYTTEFVPVVIRFRKDETAFFRNDGELLTKLTNSIEDFVTYANNKAFNQALIHLKYTAKSVRTLEIPRGRFMPEMISNMDLSSFQLKRRIDRKKWTEEITQLYQEMILGDNREQLKGTHKIKEKFEAFFNTYVAFYTANKTIELEKFVTEAMKEASESATVATSASETSDTTIDAVTPGESSTTESAPVSPSPIGTPAGKAKREFDEALNLYEQDVRAQGFNPELEAFDRNNKIHAFFLYDIDNIDSSTGDVKGFSPWPAGQGFVFIFMNAINTINATPSGTIAHEIGHALSLIHTFEGNENNNLYAEQGRRDKAAIEGERAVLQKEKDSLIVEKSRTEKEDPRMATYKSVKGSLQTKISNAKRFGIDYIDEVDNEIIAGFTGIVSGTQIRCINLINLMISRLIEFEALLPLPKIQSVPLTDERRNEIDARIDEIDRLRAQLETQKSSAPDNIILKANLSKSATDENFMDYTQDSSGNLNSNFVHKSFWYWQCKKMQEMTRYLQRIILPLFLLAFWLFGNKSYAQENLYYQCSGKGGYYSAMELDTVNCRAQMYISDPKEKEKYFSIYFEFKPYGLRDRFPYFFLKSQYLRCINDKQPDLLDIWLVSNELFEDESFNFNSHIKNNWKHIGFTWMHSKSVRNANDERYLRFPYPFSFKRIKKINWKKFPKKLQKAIQEDREKILLRPKGKRAPFGDILFDNLLRE